MANYKSQYTGEQIDEGIGKSLSLDVTRILSAVEKVETAPNIYNYDGTVIIEKAESVLGLRTIKEDYIPNEEFEYNFSFTADFSALGATTPVECSGVKCVYDSDESVYILFYKEKVPTYAPDSGELTALIANNEGSNLIAPNINVISCDDETAKAWLLANTEGVSV